MENIRAIDYPRVRLHDQVVINQLKFNMHKNINYCPKSQNQQTQHNVTYYTHTHANHKEKHAIEHRK